MNSSDDDFVAPPFDRDVALDAYLAECPRTATTRGTFFEFVQKLAQKPNGEVDERLFEGVVRQRWMAFKSYPLSDFMRLAHNAASICFPGVPTGEGLRRVGWSSFTSFASTMAGRVVLFSLGDRLEDLVLVTPKSYALTLSGCDVQVAPHGPRHYVFEMRRVYSFADTYHVGVLEGAIQTLGFIPEVLVRQAAKRCDVDFDVRWRAKPT